MVLTIDIGNTTIGIGGFQGNKLLFLGRYGTVVPWVERDYFQN